jgi:capsular exopolysaccharide synthesis family protein
MDQTRDDAQATAHVMDHLIVLWYRKWLILLTFVVLASAGLFGVFRLITPQYQAVARIAVERLRGPVADQTGIAGEAFYQTQYQIMGSSEVAAAAAVKLGRSPSSEIAREDGSADLVRSAVVVAPERDNRVVRISSKQSDAKLAAQLVNAVVDAFTEVTRQREIERAGRFQNDLQGQIVQLEMQIDAKKKALDEFAKDKNLQQQQQEQVLVATRLSALSEAQVRAKVAREQAEKMYNDLTAKAAAGENVALTVTSNYADQLKIRIKELQQQKRLMELGKTAKGLANDPAYVQAGALIDDMQRDYDETMKTAQEAANKETLDRAKLASEQAGEVEETLGQQMADMRTKLETIASGLTILGRYNELRKELENIQKWHDNLQQSLMEAKISDNFPVLDIQILDRAKAPSEPAWPNKAQLAVVSVVMSFIVAVGLAFFMDYMDRTVRKPEDVEQELRMTLFGFIPSMDSSVAGGERGKIVMIDPASGAAESYRKIRAKLYVYKKESHAKVLSITSTTAGEGKTTLASNLAIAFAQAGAKVLLVDADMRHPALQKTFGIDKEPGLAEFLDGKYSWQDAVRESAVEGLSLLPCGSGGNRSAELLESPRLRDFLEAARDKYDVVILDTPPVLGVADSTVLSNLSDATLFVIQASRNPKWLVKRARMELEAAGARIAGAILNRVRTRRGEYYYYHRYYPTKG